MNLERREGGLYFRLSMPRIHALINSYLSTDLWPVLELTTSQFHLVIGSRSRVYDTADTERARQLEAKRHRQLSLDFLNAGHWVHVDDPAGLSEVLARRLGA
jgi:pimeloyl-ACP methyl ester carboxylesterase